MDQISLLHYELGRLICVAAPASRAWYGRVGGSTVTLTQSGYSPSARSVSNKLGGARRDGDSMWRRNSIPALATCADHLLRFGHVRGPFARGVVLVLLAIGGHAQTSAHTTVAAFRTHVRPSRIVSSSYSTLTLPLVRRPRVHTTVAMSVHEGFYFFAFS